MTNILIVGAYGQLGNEFRDLHQQYPQYHFLFVDRDELDITDNDAVQACFSSFQPHICINCAAYTAVDKAEAEQEVSTAVNATAVRYLALACRQFNTRLVHISTDYVFNGNAATPYTEEDTTDPVNAYGRTKLEGEREAIENNPDSIVIRTSWVYSSHGNNFVKTMLRLMQTKPAISVVADQQGSPTYAADLAEAIMQMIAQEDWHPGIYHYSNDGIISWFDFAQAIKELTGSSCTVHPITTADYPTPAKRPAYSGLSKEKIKAVYHVPIKPWQESLERCLKSLVV